MSKTNFVDGDPSQGILGTVVTADLLNTLNNHYHTGLDQDGHGALPYAVDTGTANAYIVDLNPALTQYVTGMPIFFKATNTSTGPSTINVNGLGIKIIKKKDSLDLSAGDVLAGQIIMVVYDGINFQLVGGFDAHTIDGYHASATAMANTIPVLNASAKLPGSITGDADTIDGFHASVTPAVDTVPVASLTGGKLAPEWMEFDRSLSSPGYQKLPGGLILQWGVTSSQVVSANGAQGWAVTFPIAFPNACFSISYTVDVIASGAYQPVAYSSNDPTTTACMINYYNNTGMQQTVKVYWIALGN